MENFGVFIKKNNYIEREFLILGKGPSGSEILEINANTIVIGLNHVVRERIVDIAHIIDLDVISDVENSVVVNAKYLLMPFYPHINNKPSNKSLTLWVKEISILKEMKSQGRLLWYNLGTARKRKLGYFVSPYGYFSGDVVVGLLSTVGIKEVKVAGVDGGVLYSDNFSDLNQKTLLSNGRKSFDIQFSRIRSYIMDHNLNFSHITDIYPIKIFVATTEAQMLATKVLEYSIRKHTSSDVELIPMHLSGLTYEEPDAIENKQRTPFSFQRFLIPQLNNYKGKAIYLDSDMQVFSDIKKLWTLPMGVSDVLTVAPSRGEGRRLHFSVMLLDCKKLNWDISKIINWLNIGELTYHELMHDMKLANNISADISEHWNSLEKFDKKKTSLIHYTDMETQPWVSVENPYESVWIKDLIEAVDQGFISYSYIQDHIDKGWVRPGLIYQVKNRIFSSRKLPKEIANIDKKFKPPYEELVCGYEGVSSNLFSRLNVKAKKVLRKIIN
jgi:hypothetical protein